MKGSIVEISTLSVEMNLTNKY